MATNTLNTFEDRKITTSDITALTRATETLQALGFPKSSSLLSDVLLRAIMEWPVANPLFREVVEETKRQKEEEEAEQ